MCGCCLNTGTLKINFCILAHLKSIILKGEKISPTNTEIRDLVYNGQFPLLTEIGHCAFLGGGFKSLW
jgi:hypothetical protein